MIVYAAVDLRGGRAVQLVGGAPADVRVSRADPVETALEWQRWGFGGLHVVDLDAALGDGDNDAVVREILARASRPVQVGGGVRSAARVDELLGLGADRVIVGTRAVEDRAWCTRIAARFPHRLVVAADVSNGRVVTRGWTRETPLAIDELLADLADLPLAAVLVTDVAREGRMGGVDADLFASLARASPHPLVAAGGIRDASDLEALAQAGAYAAVVGMALYTGGIAPADLQDFDR